MGATETRHSYVFSYAFFRWNRKRGKGGPSAPLSVRSRAHRSCQVMATDALGRPGLFIGGEWVPPAQGGTLCVINPATEGNIGFIGTHFIYFRCVILIRCDGGSIMYQ